MESSSYYQKNKLALTARKRLKYQTDSAYRQKCLAYQKAYLPIARKHYFHKHAYHQARNGLWYRTLPIREFWSFIGGRHRTFKRLEAKHLMPVSIFPGVRRYSMNQVSLINEIFNRMYQLQVRSPTHSKKMQEFMKAHKVKMYDQWYAEGKSGPPGLFPATEKHKEPL